MAVICPGLLTLTPPIHMHINLQVLLTAGNPPTVTVGTPGIHGADVTGTHGIWCGTPIAAAVAAATVGWVGLLHIPNGILLAMGAWSMTLAAGIPPAMTPWGTTINADGAAPKVH